MATGYGLQVSRSNSFSPLDWGNVIASTSQVFTGLNQGTTYYFRVYANNANDTSSWSGTTNATTTVDAPAAPGISAYVSGGWAYGAAGAVGCGTGAWPVYQIAYNYNGGGMNWPGWTGTPIGTGNTQGYKYGYWSYAYCQGPNAASGSAGGNYAEVVMAINTPAAPGYAGPGSMTYNVQYAMNFTSYCPAGTSTISTTFRSLANGGNFGPHPWGFLDSWGSGMRGRVAYYWAKNQCQTSYYTSALSPESYTGVTVY
jgi:hypothetical protein